MTPTDHAANHYRILPIGWQWLLTVQFGFFRYIRVSSESDFSAVASSSLLLLLLLLDWHIVLTMIGHADLSSVTSLHFWHPPICSCSYNGQTSTKSKYGKRKRTASLDNATQISEVIVCLSKCGSWPLGISKQRTEKTPFFFSLSLIFPFRGIRGRTVSVLPSLQTGFPFVFLNRPTQIP